MARKQIKTTKITYVDPPDDDGNDKPVIDFDPAEESFGQFRSKFGTEGVLVKIYRRTPRGVQYCFSGVPSEIDEEVVRLYHAKQPYAHEEGQYSARCFVNGEGRDSFPILIGPQVAVPGSSDHGGMAQGRDGVLITYLERLEARIERMQSQEREPLSSLADAMVKLQSLQPKTEMPLDQLMKAVELGKMISGGGSDSGEWGPIIKEALSQAGPLLGALVSGLQKRQVGAIAEGETMGGGQTEDFMLRQAFAFLKRKCLAGSDPGLYIDIILDNRDDATYQKLIHAVLNKEFSSFAAIDPEIGQPPFLAFFRFIYDGLRSAIEEQNKMAGDSGGESGDASDSPSDGGARKAGGKKP